MVNLRRFFILTALFLIVFSSCVFATDEVVIQNPVTTSTPLSRAS